MYPTVSHFIKDFLGIDIPLPFNTFGLFVALAFVAGYWAFTKEAKRKESLGLIKAFTRTIEIGKPASMSNMLLNALFGFIVGYKLIYALWNYDTFVNDAQTVLLSGEGNFLGGLVLAGLFAYWEYKEKEKQKLPVPKKVVETIHPYQIMSQLVVWAAVWGFLGAKIFDNLENWDSFIQDPIAGLLSFSGLTFYGGLICGGAAVLYHANKYGIKPLHMLDIGGPGMMLAYGVGRIGCHLSGDGDWGIVNLNPKPFSWIPDWAWAYTYPNNVAGVGEAIPGCVGRFCQVLPQPVYPTPLYEVIAALFLFAVLWQIRHHIRIPGVLFGIYLIFNGLERFFIEMIRVNSKYELAGISFTQATLIAILLFIGGLFLIAYGKMNKEKLRNY